MALAEIQMAVTSLKAAVDITKAINELNMTAEVQGKVIELQSALLEAQGGALEAINAQYESQEQIRLLQKRIRELESQLEEVDDRKGQKQRYALVSPWRGPAQAYALKQSHADGEEPHLLCTNCFHNGNKVILNPKKINGFTLMICPVCKAVLETGYRVIGDIKYVEDYNAED